jgi:hypothetical protein
MKRRILLLVFSGLVLLLFIFCGSLPLPLLEGDNIGSSYYDIQTYGSCQNRIYRFTDGTIGGTWTRGMDESAYMDRGTGYNYFDGVNWQPVPEERIESKRTGWPSYAPLGVNGEIVVSYISGSDTSGLMICKRENKGEGEWMESILTGPAGHEQLLWPRMVTGGTNHNNIHLIAMTTPLANYGTLYEGLDGALLYSRSTDGGETWDIQNQILPGMDSSAYSGFYHDSYAFAEPKDNIIAFVVGSYQSDLFLMKSTDYGETFEKTIIWDNPYDLVSPAFSTEPFYSVDGSVAVALDNSGMAHIVFGIVKAWYDLEEEQWAFNKLTDGVGYWNENMETFSSNLNALDPSCGPESELVQDESLIGWSQDLNGNGVLDILGEVDSYSCYYFSLGLSSMVQLITDSQNRLFLVYSSVTETYNEGTKDYHRLWLRSSLDGGQNWGQFYHLDGDDSTSIYTDYAFPSCAAISDEKIYLTFMGDIGAGMYCYGDMCSPDENFIYFTAVPKDAIVGINREIGKAGFTVSQNFPNPFGDKTYFDVTPAGASEFSLRVVGLEGCTVFSQSYTCKGLDKIRITFEKKGLSPGIYLYSISSDIGTAYGQMIIH